MTRSSWFAGLAISALLAGSPAAQEPGTPQIWSPGVVSGDLHDAAPAFTPDGDTLYVGRSGGLGSPPPAILVSRRIADAWTRPEVAAFSGVHADMEPAVAPDGSHMVFASNRPAVDGGSPLDGDWGGRTYPGEGGALWRMERTPSGWGEPWRLPDRINGEGSTFAPAIVGDGSLYFMRPDPVTRRFRLYRVDWRNGSYGEPEPLPFSTGEQTDVDPTLPADESFMVFSSSGREGLARDMEMFAVFRKPDGTWGAPVHLAHLGSPGSDAEPRLSSDSRRLYFSSERIDPAAPAGQWNNGLYNIWSAGLDADLMRRLRSASTP